MKKIILLGFFVVVIISAYSNPIQAEESLSANVGATSNYIWRGLEQTSGNAAVFGGIDYTQSSGFYLGTWASNVDFGDSTTYELDLYAGWSGEINGFNLGIGYIHYAYPDSNPDLDFSEVLLSFGFSNYTIGYATIASGEGVSAGDDSYISFDANFELKQDLAINFHVGHGTDEFYAGESYLDYGISLSKNEFTFGLSNTDLNDSDVKFYVSYTMALDL